MRRYFLLTLTLLLFSVAAVAQQTGTLTITVQQAAEPALAVPAPAMDAKVIVVHWTHGGMHPSLEHDQVGTTNQMGICTMKLPPGTYDIFVAASELAPAAFRREIKAGATTSVVAHLRAAPLHLQPVK